MDLFRGRERTVKPTKGYFELNYKRERVVTRNLFPISVSQGGDESFSTSGGSSTTIIGGTGGGGSIDLTNINADLITANNINAQNISANLFTGNVLDISVINGFTTSQLSDVTLLGSDNDTKIFWDSSAGIFYIDADLRISNPTLTLNDDPDISPNNSETEDMGFFFRWWDSNINAEKLGFMGFDLSTQEFKIYNDTTVNGIGQITSGDLGSFVMNNISLNTITGLGDMDITNTNGGLDILVSSGINDEINIMNDNSNINLITNSSNQDSITLDSASGGVNITTGLDLNITSNTVNNTITDYNIIAGINTLSFDETNGLEITNPKTDYRKWFNYKDFDFFNGVWKTTREIISGNPVYYWEKEEENETSYISLDLTETIRENLNKGYRLKSIKVYYEILNQNTNSMNLLMTKKTFDDVLQDKTIANIIYTGNFSSNLIIDNHFVNFDITSPIFLNDYTTISMEIELDTNINTLFRFYGVFCDFDYNHN